MIVKKFIFQFKTSPDFRDSSSFPSHEKCSHTPFFKQQDLLFLNDIINAVVNHSQQAAVLKESKGKKVKIAAFKGIFVVVLYLVGFFLA